MGQYASIVEYSSEGTSCGAPGETACPTLPSCVGPSGNILRDDEFTGFVVCDLSGSAEFGGDGSHTLPQLLYQYQVGDFTPGDTIFTSTDLHFGKPTVSDLDHARHTRYLNQFAASGTHWPRGVGFPDEAIHVPAAIVTTGDDTHYGHENELGDYRLLYEQNWIHESTNFPVIPGLGNHDVD